MALDPKVLEDALFEADIELIRKAHVNKDQTPPELSEDEEATIREKAEAYSLAIYNWLVEGGITTEHVIGSINVAGTPSAQSNVVPVFGKVVF